MHECARIDFLGVDPSGSDGLRVKILRAVCLFNSYESVGACIYAISDNIPLFSLKTPDQYIVEKSINRISRI